MTTETIHETVREHYAAAAVSASQGTSCCSDPSTVGAHLYSALERDELPDAAVLASLGCGNPTAVAVDSNGAIYVAEVNGTNVKKFVKAKS